MTNSKGKMYCLAFVFTFLFPLIVFSQQIPFYNSGELIKSGIEEHDKGNYKKAIDFFSKVPEGDTNYLWALYEQSLSNQLDSNFEETIVLCKKALKYKYEDKRQVLLNMGTAYHSLGKDDDAIRLYDSVALLFPHDNRPLFEKSIIFFFRKDYATARKLLQQSVILNPLHYRSHALLGNIYLLEGRLTEAMIALQASLLCTNDINVAQKSITLLNALSLQTEEVATFYKEKKAASAHPLFDEIDEIVHAKLALNKGYELKTSIDDNIIRQLQVVMEKLVVDKDDTSFVMQYYVPVLKQVYDDNMFEPYVLLLFSEYGIKSVDKMAEARKGKTSLENIRNLVYPYLSKIAATRVLDLNSREKAVEQYHHFSKDNMLIVGRFSDKATRKFAAGFVQFFEQNNRIAEGNYTAESKKTGAWKYYYPSGTLKLEELYKNDKLYGSTTSYYKNGNARSVAQLDDKELVTSSKEYSYDGHLESISSLKNKEEYEVTYYHPDGAVMRKVILVNDQVKDGTYNLLYPDGKTEKEMTYKGRKLNGIYKEYYRNGVVKEECHMLDDKADGLYAAYHSNGKPASRINYIKGVKQGLSEEFDEEGNLVSSKEFRNDKLNGALNYYDKKGKIFGALIMKEDEAVSARFTDQAGNVVYEQHNSKGINPYEIYNEYGIKTTSLLQDEAGRVEGKAMYYFLSGGLKEESMFKADKPDGPSVSYHKNSRISMERHYKEGVTDGYYKSYHSNGKAMAEGWIKDDASLGVWHQYHPNGSLQRAYFLLNGTLNGPEKNYANNGKLDFINYYDHGMITGLAQYDSAGKVIQELIFEKGNGRYTLVYPDGKPAFQVALRHGAFDGPYQRIGPNNMILDEGAYKSNERQGVCTTYYPNGKIRLKGSYENGQKEGIWTMYNEAGELENKTAYQDNNIHGLDQYYSGGQLRYETNFRDNLKDGTVTLYGEDKKIAGIFNYDRGTMVSYTYEGKDGGLLPAIPVIKGTAVIKTYYPDGSKALVFNLVNNCYDGSQQLYYNNGRIAEERYFSMDNFDGVYNRFNPDGSPLITCNFKNDVQQGQEQKYDHKGKLISRSFYHDGQPDGRAGIIDEAGKTMKEVWYYQGDIQ